MRAFYLGLPLALALALGCHKRPAQDGPVLARVGDSVITARDLETRIAMFGHSRYLMDHYSRPEKRKELLDGLVQSEALYQEACRLGYDHDPAVKRDVVNRMLQNEVDAKVNAQNVSDAELEQYYQAHASDFSRPDQVRVAQIVVKDRARAILVAAEAKALPKGNGGALRALVTQYSEDEASRVRGGDVGPIDRTSTSLPKTVVEAAFALPQIHDVSEPIATENGYTVIILTQKQPGFSKTLAEAKTDVQSRLTTERRQQQRNAFTAEIRGKTKVNIDEAQLAQMVLPLAGPAKNSTLPLR